MVIFRQYVKKFQVSLKSDKEKGTLHEDPYTFMKTSRLIPLRMKNVSDKCRENQNTHLMFSKFLPPPPKILSFMR